MLQKLGYGRIKLWLSGFIKQPPPLAPYLHIIQLGDPVLRLQAEHVPTNLIKSSEMQFLIDRMLRVTKRYDCVGLAASQIGIALRVIVIKCTADDWYSLSKGKIENHKLETLPQTVIINPELKVLDYTKVIHSETCGSINGFCADVARYNEVQVNGFNQNGDEITINTKGLLARIVQHELDHLNGIVYTDIMEPKTLSCSYWQEINKHRGKVELPFNK